MRSIRVLGVDPGLTRCGLGVVDGALGGRVVLVDVEVARTPAGDEIGARLVEIERRIETMLDRYEPHVVAVERVFSQHNVRLGHGHRPGVCDRDHLRCPTRASRSRCTLRPR